MAFPVKFKATVTGTISDLDVIIQNSPVPSPSGKVNVTENYSTHGILTIRFRISGFSGTGFKIVYSCNSNGNSTSDVTNPSPIEASIEEGGFKELRLKIPV